MHPRNSFEDHHHVQMCKIHASLKDMASTELEFIFSEDEQQGAQMGFTLQQVWEEDKLTQHEAACKSFQKRSMKNSELGTTYTTVQLLNV